MNFSINVNLTDNDYYIFNKFCLLKSRYGKKRAITFRLLLVVITLFPVIYTLLRDGLTVMIVPNILLLIIFQLLIIPFYSLVLKLNIRALKKSGKLPYNITSQLDFLDDSFIEITSDGKNETKYSAIQCVSITDAYIYIHINSLLGHILPRSAFESEEQYSKFLEFLKTKCSIIDAY